ncbi:hypothetical protein B296_00016997 [Ensete ventricosum]|uniref:Uncharacterized protein n=1 Tax=Ensete ventricosum TaxID=4639 RepID=A0A426Y239_ENSVE|nr:hypothetical protein B296_00016997 [Ensete ventricosum]
MIECQAPVGCAPPQGGARPISPGQARELPTRFLAGDLALQGRVGSAPCVPESRPGLFVIVGAPTEGEPPSSSSGG